MVRCNTQSSAKSRECDFTLSGRSLIHTRNKSGRKTVPRGTPGFTPRGTPGSTAQGDDVDPLAILVGCYRLYSC